MCRYKKNKVVLYAKKKKFSGSYRKDLARKEITKLLRKWFSEGSTESVPTEKALQISSPEKSSPDKVLQKRLYRKGFILRVSEELKIAKIRTEAL